MKLSNIILEDDYWSKFKTESQELENEMKDTYVSDSFMSAIDDCYLIDDAWLFNS